MFSAELRAVAEALFERGVHPSASAMVSRLHAIADQLERIERQMVVPRIDQRGVLDLAAVKALAVEVLRRRVPAVCTDELHALAATLLALHAAHAHAGKGRVS